jgi:hypothetical protein
MNACSPSPRFSAPRPTGVTPLALVAPVDTVSQLLSISVTQYSPREGGGEGRVKIQNALPRTQKEAEDLDTIYNGPIWRLVGNLMEFKAQNGPLSDEGVQDLLRQYVQAYRWLCEKNKFMPVSEVAVEDAFYEQRRKRMVPTGVHPVKWAADKAKSEPPPPEAARYAEDEPRRLLVAVCWHLSTLKGNQKPFPLSCRTLEEHLGFHGHSKWAAILKQFCTTRPPILREVSKGKQFTPNGPQASEYEFLVSIDASHARLSAEAHAVTHRLE